MAETAPDTLAALRTLFPEPKVVSEANLHEFYGHVAPPCLDAYLIIVTLDTLRACSAAAPPLSSPHKDMWRVEHFIPLAADPDCGEALAAFTSVIGKGEVSQKIGDLLSSATLVILLKKDVETMEEMKRVLGDAYVQPQRPLGMGSSLVKVASDCTL